LNVANPCAIDVSGAQIAPRGNRYINFRRVILNMSLKLHNLQNWW